MTQEEKRRTILCLFPELNGVSQETADAICAVWVHFWTQSAWKRPEQAAFKPDANHDLTLVRHTQCVVKAALAVAGVMERVQGVRIDRDALIALALLHDVSKLIEYEPAPDGSIRESTRGALFPHAFWGACKAGEEGLSDAVVAEIACHPIAMNTEPRTPEGWILHGVDRISARIGSDHAKGGKPYGG